MKKFYYNLQNDIENAKYSYLGNRIFADYVLIFYCDYVENFKLYEIIKIKKFKLLLNSKIKF